MQKKIKSIEINSKQQKVSLIEDGNRSQTPQIIKTNGITTSVKNEAQNDKKERGKALRQIVAAFIANIGKN